MSSVSIRVRAFVVGAYVLGIVLGSYVALVMIDRVERVRGGERS